MRFRRAAYVFETRRQFVADDDAQHVGRAAVLDRELHDRLFVEIHVRRRLDVDAQEHLVLAQRQSVERLQELAAVACGGDRGRLGGSGGLGSLDVVVPLRIQPRAGRVEFDRGLDRAGRRLASGSGRGWGSGKSSAGVVAAGGKGAG